MRRVKLAEIVSEIESGKRPKGGKRNKGIPSIGAGELSGDGGFNFNKLGYIPEEYFYSLRSGVIKKNDIIIVKDGATTGKTSFVTKGFPFKKAAVNEHVFILRPELEKVLSKYLFWFLYSPIGFDSIMQDFRGATVGGISKKFIQKINIPLPSLSEQKTIVAKLDRAQRLIDIDKEMLAKYDDLIQSVFLEMFGDPVRNSKGWERKQMQEIGEMKSGGTPSRKNKEYFTGDIDWYTTGELESMYLGEAEEKITETAIEESSAKLFEKGSLLIGMYDTSAFKLGILTDPGSSNQASANIKLDDEICNVEWLYYCLKIMRPSILHERRGIRQKNLTLGFLKKLEIIMPPLEKQLQFSKSLKKITDEKESTELMTKKSEELFSSLVQEAFG